MSPSQPSPIRFGALCWNQYTDWPALLEAGIRADRLGYDTLWTWDHLYPIVGDPHGPNYEGWLTLDRMGGARRSASGSASWSAPTRTASRRSWPRWRRRSTTSPTAGPSSGIGAAWFESEAHDFGFEFGYGPPERLRWLGQALPIMRGMLDGTEPSAAGPTVPHRPRPQPPGTDPAAPADLHRGRRREGDPRLVARYADMNNVGGGVEEVGARSAILLDHCTTVGPGSSARSSARPASVRFHPRRPRAKPTGCSARLSIATSRPSLDGPAGGHARGRRRPLAPYVELGYRHLIAGVPAPYDEESMTRFVTEVKPLLERQAR